MEAMELHVRAVEGCWSGSRVADGSALGFAPLVFGVATSPSSEKPKGPGPRDAAAAEATPGPRGTILILDDEGDIVESYRRLIERLFPGVVVRTATKPDHALDLLRREAVNVIISDYRMPGMDGLEFLAAARSIQPAAHRLLLTAYLNEELESQVEAKAAPAACLSKASSLDALVERIRNELPPRG